MGLGRGDLLRLEETEEAMTICVFCGKGGELSKVEALGLDWHHTGCLLQQYAEVVKERDAALRMVEALQAVIEECRQMLYLDGYELGAYITATLIPSIRAAQSLTLPASLETLKREREDAQDAWKVLESIAKESADEVGTHMAKAILESRRKERGV